LQPLQKLTGRNDLNPLDGEGSQHVEVPGAQRKMSFGTHIEPRLLHAGITG
jgi:hypothetical protein